MVADVQIHEVGNYSPDATDKTGGTVRLKNADDPNVTTSNPMVIPPSGLDYSFKKYLQTFFNTAPASQITDLEAYMDGANGFGTGITLYMKAGALATPAEAVANDVGSPSDFVDAFSYTSGAPLALGAGPHTGTGRKGNAAILFLTVANTATQGVLSSESYTTSYDEI